MSRLGFLHHLALLEGFIENHYGQETEVLTSLKNVQHLKYDIVLSWTNILNSCNWKMLHSFTLNIRITNVTSNQLKNKSDYNLK